MSTAFQRPVECLYSMMHACLVGFPCIAFCVWQAHVSMAGCMEHAQQPVGAQMLAVLLAVLSYLDIQSDRCGLAVVHHPSMWRLLCSWHLTSAYKASICM